MLTEKEIGVVTMYNEEEKGRQKQHASEFLSRFFRRRTKRLLTNIDRLFHKIMCDVEPRDTMKMPHIG